ncbi:Prefoldin [Pseudocohnilembus persalinus]|uniref:Prefoldin n=1 Tax=Pseudocohnilembus persalinus TaxID=266149 RepID=A0A0V0Q7J7_PSEPJ|nr:Prefoldin [Pseudocohnilembus persalinus]|eukprot:KRW98232.1 Prefoldin [Pseudocohnilembus persalinus]
MLLHQFDKAIEEQENKINSLEKTIPRLKHMPEKLSHVSIEKYNSVMYLPVKIYHTNEVLVSLGNDYFVETVSKKAIEIANSRKQFMEIELKKLQHTREKILQKYKDISLMQNQSVNEDGSIDIKEPMTLAHYENWENAKPKNKKKQKILVKEEKLLQEIKDLEKNIQKNEQKQINGIFEGVSQKELDKLEDQNVKLKIKLEKLKFQAKQNKQVGKSVENQQKTIQEEQPVFKIEPIEEEEEQQEQEQEKPVQKIQEKKQKSILKKKQVKFSAETEKNQEEKKAKKKQVKQHQKPREVLNIMDSIAPDESESEIGDSDFSDSDFDYDKLNQNEDSDNDDDDEEEEEEDEEDIQQINQINQGKQQQLEAITEVNENENEQQKDKIIPGQRYTKEELNQIFQQQVSSVIQIQIRKIGFMMFNIFIFIQQII